MRSVSIHGVKEEFESAYTVSTTIIGKTAAPANVTNFEVTASGNVVNFTADDVTDPDVVGYEIRMGDSWASGSFIGFNLSPRFRASYISPGTKTFWIAARDNAGNYSATPASDTVVVPTPSNFSFKDEWAWDYDGIGTHDNTEHTTHESADALKCSHTGGVLTGTWQSPTYDAGSVKRLKVFGDFLTALVPGSKTWAGIFPGTWEAKANKTWEQILNTEYAGVLSATLHYGEASWDENELPGFESLAPEIDARYLRVDVTITDPESDANLYVYTLNMTALSYE